MTALLMMGKLLRYLFGILFIAIGGVNTFWGNDPFFGVFILALALLFFPPVAAWVHRVIGFSLPAWTLVLVAFFICWAAMGVGELPEKINLMRADLNL